MTQRHWFNNVFFTWGDDALTRKCSGQDIATGSQFFTSNKGLSYTLLAVKSQNGPGSESQLQPSISYLNNTLQNCRVNTIDIYLNKADDSSPGHSWWYSWTFSTAKAEAQCDVINKDDTFTIRFAVTYAQLIAERFDYVISDDYGTHASVWWGTRLLLSYFNGMQNIIAGSHMKCTVGHLTYNTTQVESIRDNRLFDLHYWLLSADSGLDHTPENSSASQIYNNQSERLAPILTEGLFFSKVFYSLILVDLGILSDRKLNPPLDPELLRYALNPINDFNRQGNGTLTKTDRLDPWKYSNIRPPNNPFPDENDTIPMREAYDKLSDFVKPLGTQNATIYWQYSCQVPKKRSVATVALLVLVADFVLLQTAWMIMTFVADRLVSRKPQQCGVKGA